MFRPLLKRFLAVAEVSPERECIIDGDRRVTYAEMARSVRSAGARLGELIAPGDRVALLMDNSVEYVAGCYGTWWAGGVVVGLNTALKAEDLLILIRHSGARCLVADPAQRELPRLREMLGGAMQILDLVRSASLGASEADVSAAPSLPPDTLASLIYTSGTTGHPKGVMLTHGNLAANTDSICDYLAIDAHERVLCVLPFYYSFGASILHTHVVSGAAIVVENSFMYPHRVLEKMVAERVTSFSGVPATYYLLLRRTDLSAYDLSSLRYVTQAGGRMEPLKIDDFRAQIPGVEFVVMYGQTEATARLAFVPAEDLDRKTRSAGRAIPGVELCVRNDHGEDLPPGVPGEVCARGANVMRGYWNAPEETVRVLQDGWLRTGDLGYMDEDGYLFLQGRSSEMIKSGAHRITPAEIEEVVRTVPGVDDVAVVGVDDEVLGEAVKACVIARSPGATLKQEIQRTCRDRLALFKVPKTVEFYEEFPRTSSGKIRRRLL